MSDANCVRVLHNISSAMLQFKMLNRRDPVIGAVLIRLALLCYGIYHDTDGEINYTDIDYVVLTDGARCICDGRSPYSVQGYRYPPLLAVLLTPTCHCFAFGKILFILADVAVVVLIVLNIEKNARNSRWGWFWALNPFAAMIPSRGSFDPISNALVLACLYTAQNYCPVQSGLLLGTAVYLRFYPVIYGPAIVVFFLGESWNPVQISSYHLALQSLRFTTAAIFAFVTLFAISHYFYGVDYLEAAITYHMSRLDHRHNFSPHFLEIYLAGDVHIGSMKYIIFLTSTLPQLALVLCSSLVLARQHLAVCMLISTMTFVSFNKVSTSQYFTWYAIFIPIVFGTGATKLTYSFVASVAMWALSACLWLFFAYKLEFTGLNWYIYVWLCSLLFQLSNVNMVINIMRQIGTSYAVLTSDVRLLNKIKI